MIDREDIDALLEDADEQLERVRELYQDSLEEQEAPRALKTRIKNVVEHDRSALEYLAHAIYDRHGDGKGRRSYYPVANCASEFPDLLKRHLPGVPLKSRVARAIEQRQPYRPGYEWLAHLVALTNENKHRRLTPQTRTEQLARTRSEYPGAIVDEDHIRANLRIEPPPGSTNTILRGEPVRRVERTIYVDWLFEEPTLSALDTLETIQAELPDLIDDVIDALPKRARTSRPRR